VAEIKDEFQQSQDLSGLWGEASSPGLPEWSKQAAQKDYNIISGGMQGLAAIPRMAFGASEMMRQSGSYDPKPILDAAMLPMGTGAIAGVPLKAGEAVLGSGFIDIWKTDPKTIAPGQFVSAGTAEGASVGQFKGMSKAGLPIVDWKAKPPGIPEEDMLREALKKPLPEKKEMTAEEALERIEKAVGWDNTGGKIKDAIGYKEPVTAGQKYKMDISADQLGFKNDLAAAKTRYQSELSRNPLRSVNPEDRETLRQKGGYTEPAARGVRLYQGKEVNPVYSYEYDNQYSTASPMLADMYAGGLQHHPGIEVPEGTFNESSSVMPLYLDIKDYHYADAKGAHWSSFNPVAIKEAKKLGKKGVIVDNVWDEPGSTHNLSGPQKVVITFPEGASTVKSRFASRFDPSSPNMMQGVGAIGIGGPAGYVSMAHDGAQSGQEKPQQQGQQISPGVMQWMTEFLKQNPDIAKEMSVRMQAVINGNQMKGAGPQQNTMRPLAQGAQQQ